MVDIAPDSGNVPASRASSCCAPAKPAKPASGCCPSTAARPRTDWMLWGSAIACVAGYAWYLFLPSHGTDGPVQHSPVEHFAHGVFEMVNIMWWGVLLGIFFVGLMDRVPREVIISALTGRTRTGGLLRATAAGVAFDLCNHGILMVGMKLYERGATIGQTVAFLLASPWNSFSLTVIMIALIGWEFTAAFIVLSGVIGITTGYIFDRLVDAGRLPPNPAREGIGDAPAFGAAFRTWWSGVTFDRAALPQIVRAGMAGSRMVLRWLLFGIVLAATIRALIPADVFADWFGPTLIGITLTVIATTIIEVCSEGSTPIAADLVGRAGAPGNGFVFLMGGVATDYTEVMSLKDTTRSWRIALALPLIALPQTVLVGALLNMTI